eukprot:COSAG02_NODE_1256_length_13576_cov_12.901981_11_plen_47_part_00
MLVRDTQCLSGGSVSTDDTASAAAAATRAMLGSGDRRACLFRLHAL